MDYEQSTQPATGAASPAGWLLPRAEQLRFPAVGTHLERYARVLHGAEINASFYRPLRPARYAKWAAAVPEDFRFAVKVPKELTHEHRLLDCEESLAMFLEEVAALDGKLGPLLVQLPPSLEYDASLAGASSRSRGHDSRRHCVHVAFSFRFRIFPHAELRNAFSRPSRRRPPASPARQAG